MIKFSNFLFYFVGTEIFYIFAKNISFILLTIDMHCLIEHHLVNKPRVNLLYLIKLSSVYLAQRSESWKLYKTV